jgi:hypothetical protein
MKIKYIAAICLYFVTFTLSVLIVGLPNSQSLSNRKPCFRPAPPVVETETELQTRIRKFLEADLQTGIELTNDKVRLSHSNSPLRAEEIATSNLIKKMEKVKCDGLPEDFCSAWDAHLIAWRYKAFILERELRGKSLNFTYSNDKIPSEQISNSYHNMLAVARTYGVDFKY